MKFWLARGKPFTCQGLEPIRAASRSANPMASKPEGRPASPPPVTWLAEPLKRFHDEAWHTPQGRLVREVIFGLNDGVISTIGFLAGVTATLGDVRTIALGGIAAAIARAGALGVGALVSSQAPRAFFPAQIAPQGWGIEEHPRPPPQGSPESY